MIDRIVLTPSPDGEGLLVDIEGALAGLLRLATGLPVGQKAPSAVLQGADIADELVLVAGAGFGHCFPRELYCHRTYSDAPLPAVPTLTNPAPPRHERSTAGPSSLPKPRRGR